MIRAEHSMCHPISASSDEALLSVEAEIDG